jgi:leader peptidase (prepilin peptidase) / N-methyltransferase
VSLADAPTLRSPAATPLAKPRDCPGRAEIAAAWQRPLVLVGAAALAAIVLAWLGFEPRGFVGAGFAATLVVISAIDLRYRLIPNRIVLPATAVVLVAQIAFYPDQALEWVGGALGAALFLLLPTLVLPAGIGMGDVKLALLIGAMLGKEVLPALLLGFVSVWPVAIYLFARHGRAARKHALPFGPPLAFGAVVMLLLSG